MRTLRIAILILAALAGAGTARAEELLFGSEFTFTNDRMAGGSESASKKARESYRQSILGTCAGRQSTAGNACRVTYLDSHGRPTSQKTGRWRIEYPNVQLPDGRGKFWIEVGLDTGVIETQMPPMSAAEWRSHKAVIQADLFDHLSGQGLKPRIGEGGGHINLGYRYFKDRPKLLAAFVADYAAHPELAMGAFGEYDPETAKHVTSLSRERREILDSLIRDLRNGVITPDEFSQRVIDDVYYKAGSMSGQSTKNHALNFNHAVEGSDAARRLELRGVGAQGSMDDWLRDITLMETWVADLETRVDRGQFPNFDPAARRPRITHTDELASRFRSFVESLGLSWDDYGARARTAWGSASVASAVPLPQGADCSQTPAEFFTKAVTAF